MNSYSVKNLKGCKVIKGTIPVQELIALLNAWDAEWVVDGELARALSVNVVVGPAKALKDWRQELRLDD